MGQVNFCPVRKTTFKGIWPEQPSFSTMWQFLFHQKNPSPYLFFFKSGKLEFSEYLKECLAHIVIQIVLISLNFVLSLVKHFEMVVWKTLYNQAIGWSIWLAVRNYKWKIKRVFSCYAALVINGKYIFLWGFYS